VVVVVVVVKEEEEEEDWIQQNEYQPLLRCKQKRGKRPGKMCNPPSPLEDFGGGGGSSLFSMNFCTERTLLIGWENILQCLLITYL
jgi:hypothetical protein